LTERLYYTDSYRTRFEACVLEVRPAAAGYSVYLDRTAFYPSSGGQPCDTGRIGDLPVVDVVDEEDRIAHLVERPPDPGPADCRIDWDRRFDHMQQHTGQHLLSAVFVEQFGFSTVSFHLGAEASTIDLAAAALSPRQIEEAESRANALVFENRPVTVGFYTAAEAAAIGLRKPSGRDGTVRVVEIAGCDRSACGGTHVHATGEIGPILIRRLDKVRGNARVEFLCGGRAVRRARADYDALERIAQSFSAPLDQAPALAVAQMETLKSAGKERQKLEAELAGFRGRELYAKTPPDERGRRLHCASQETGGLEGRRPLAQAFVAAGPAAVFLLRNTAPPAILLAVSPDLGVDAGRLLQSVIEPLGGRGGGSAQLAQGSLPDPARLADACTQIVARLA
jgi:alanyl-tRNA synthetase